MYEVPLTRIDEMADVSAEAFIGCDDPVGNFMFQNEPEHLVLKRRFFRSLATTCSANAVRQATSSNLEAASIWFPPGMDHSEGVEPDPFGTDDFADSGTMRRMQAVNDVIAALADGLGQEPQWYLHLVAVRPRFRERGYSSVLIRPMLARADEENLPCTLITQSLGNVRKYESWGFKVVREIPVPRSNEKFRSMRREAGAT